jgi:hypothetical protein
VRGRNKYGVPLQHGLRVEPSKPPAVGRTGALGLVTIFGRPDGWCHLPELGDGVMEVNNRERSSGMRLARGLHPAGLLLLVRPVVRCMQHQVIACVFLLLVRPRRGVVIERYQSLPEALIPTLAALILLVRASGKAL